MSGALTKYNLPRLQSALMPELPEVQCTCLSLTESIVGRRVIGVTICRSDVIHGKRSAQALLDKQQISRITRHGKQMGIIATSNTSHDQGRCVCVHLGMSGSLRYYPPLTNPDQTRQRSAKQVAQATHDHVIWQLDCGGRLVFRDPRRFGGLWTFTNTDELWSGRWHHLGEDALRITPSQLHARLSTTRRSVKATLLDQHVLAGLGNIYVDELLFACHIHPLTSGCDLNHTTITSMVYRLRQLLKRAIKAGGSTVRDFTDGDGSAGRFQNRHQVYGRAGRPCLSCHSELSSIVVAGRTTVYCHQCQGKM